MSDTEDKRTTDNAGAARRRRKRKNYALLVLAAGILLFGLSAGALYWYLRPITLRVAVGPPNSDDQKLIQTLAQTFARDRSPIRLTPKEYDLLVLLARHAGRVVTHKTLLKSVWGPAHGDDLHYLRVFIGQLRGKIEADGYTRIGPALRHGFEVLLRARAPRRMIVLVTDAKPTDKIGRAHV